MERERNVSLETFSRETLDPWYVTGFVDADGTFTYSRSGKQIALYFAIKLTATDQPTLESIQEFFGGIGKIYEVKARPPGPRSGATKTAAYYRVTHRDDLIRVVEHFDAYPLRTTKCGVYEIWRLMVLAKQQFRNPDRSMLDALADQITARSSRKQSWR
jgi:hypothetical protein